MGRREGTWTSQKSPKARPLATTPPATRRADTSFTGWSLEGGQLVTGPVSRNMEVALKRTFDATPEPKLVVATFVLDDLVRSRTAFRYRNGWIRKPTFVLEEGELVPRRPEHSPARLARWFERDTRLGELWRRAARKLELATGLGEGWELNRALFEAMRDACRAGGAELAVVFLPSGGQFEPNPMFERAFGELEIRFLDLGTLPCADPRALFFEHDPHLNAAGQRWVGTVLCDFLDDVGLCKATG